ncbi:putative protein ESKIMO 1 [Cocos nucifera]|uniref:Trichome birefringence-like N-terminal domain-containing protein n=1 Tax=Cocos nucifera TaxID=13894 RepID=A0A8K0I6Q3_COCNU|nr:putative protein ESKIMO 1 [Cocos nucifera]
MRLLTSSNRKRSYYFYLVTLSFIIFAAILYTKDFSSILKHPCLRYRQLEYSSQRRKPTAFIGNQGERTALFKREEESSTLTQADEAKILDEEVMVNFEAVSKQVEEGVILDDGDEEGAEELEGENHGGVPFAVGRTEEGCDVFSGKWVYDEVSRPHYTEKQCRFISPQMKCQAFGRPDKAYQHWRWQPHGCSLPRRRSRRGGMEFIKVMEAEDAYGLVLKRMVVKANQRISFSHQALKMKLLFSISNRKNAVHPYYFIPFSFLIFVAILYAADFTSILQEGCSKYQQLEYSTQKESKALIAREEEPRPTPIHGEETKLFDQIIVEPTILAQDDQEAKIFNQVIAEPTATASKESKSLESGDEIEAAKTQVEEAKNSDEISSKKKNPDEGDTVEPAEEKDLGVPFAVGKMEEGCDLFSGKWVYDDARPHYRERDCRFISSQFTCQAHGRPDRLYQYWRWQPHGCSLPSFNATFMLERLRGKRMLFVGDSLNRGQYSSMLCLLQHAIPKFSRSHKHHASHTVFTAPEYNASFEFYWAPFLVESNCDNASVHRVTDRVVHEYMGSLERHAQHWKGVDILVFNTRRYRGRKYIRLMATEEGYRMVLRSMLGTCSPLLDQYLIWEDCRGMDWGSDPHGTCYGETTPIFDPTYWGSGASKSIMQVVGEVLGESKVPITVVNITQLSLYRKDAHTSIYKELRSGAFL